MTKQVQKRESVDSGVMLPAEVVRDNVRTALQQQPNLISYDPTTEEGELVSLRCAVDPGIPAQQRDGWRGTVVQWGISAYDVNDEQRGEIVTLPSLALISSERELIRLTGWPAIKSFGQIVRHLGIERCRRGVPIVVKRRASGTAGRSYWIVLPDA